MADKKQFMFLIMGTGEGMTEMPKDEFDAHMAKWFAWDKELTEKGIKLHGEALQSEGSKTVRGKDMEATDGFFSDNKDVVIGGYYVINAESMEEAVETSKGCPTFELDGNIEVREIAEMSK